MRFMRLIFSFTCVFGLSFNLTTMLGCRCESTSKTESNASNILDKSTPSITKSASISPPAGLSKPSRAPSYLRVSDPQELRQYTQFEAVRHFDLSPPPVDASISTKPASGIGNSPNLPCNQFRLDTLAKLMPDLLRLRISGCESVLGTGLSAFAPSLEALELIDQTLDRKIASEISKLEQLQDLRLSRVAMSEDTLSQLRLGSRLDTLVLRDIETNSKAIESWLGQVSRSLSTVELEGPWVQARVFSKVEKMGRLRNLTLTEPAIGTYSLYALKDLGALQHIRWSGAKFNDSSPLYIRELPIESMHCNCPGLGNLGLHHLRYLQPTLRSLSLEQTAISPEGFGSLGIFAELESLSIRDSELGEIAFKTISTLKNLRELNLVGGTLLPTRRRKLALEGPLRRLSIQSNNFGDVSAEELSNLISLEHLDLSRTEIGDAGLRNIVPLKNLKSLKLHHTRVTARGLEALSNLQQLEVLELDHTDVVDSGVKFLAGLEKLRELRLDHTLITDAALLHLSRLYNLERINLAGTVVTNVGVDSLKVLPRLIAVNVSTD